MLHYFKMLKVNSIKLNQSKLSEYPKLKKNKTNKQMNKQKKPKTLTAQHPIW